MVPSAASSPAAPLSLAWGSNDLLCNPLQVFGFHSDLATHVSTCDPDFWWFSTATSTALVSCCSIAVSKPSPSSCPSSSPPAIAYKRAVATTECLLTLAPLTVTLLRLWPFPWSVLMGRRSGHGILHAGCLDPSISSSTIDHGIPRIESSLFRVLGAIPVEFIPSPGVLTRILDLRRLRPESMPS